MRNWKQWLQAVEPATRNLKVIYATLAVLGLVGAAFLIAAGASIAQYAMRSDRAAMDAERASWAAERSNWSAERATLYGRILRNRLDDRQTCEAEKSDVRTFYRTIGNARDKQYEQLAATTEDLRSRLKASASHDAEQDRRLGILLDQNAALLQSSDHRAAAADQIIQNTNVAVEKATQAADAAQQAVKATEQKK